jgi:enoyl-[acyl-carrier-protein] reductase (NADH)
VEILSKGLPVARACNDDDLSAALVFLASEHSGYMTGSTLFVDGGMSTTFPMSM